MLPDTIQMSAQENQWNAGEITGSCSSGASSCMSGRSARVVLYLVFHTPPCPPRFIKKLNFYSMNTKPKEHRLNCPNFLADAIYEEHHSIR